MQRHQRHFHGKRQKEAPPQKLCNTSFNTILCLLHIGSCSPPAVQLQNTRKHCQTSNQGVKNQLICCSYFSSSASPKSNLLEHGQQRTFIQYIKTQSVQPCKSPKQKAFQSQLQCIERLTMHILGIPTALYCQRHLYCCKQYHPKT